MKSGKSPDGSSVQIEAIKYVKGLLHSRIYKLIALMWEHQKILKDWKKSIILPIHKKGIRWNVLITQR